MAAEMLVNEGVSVDVYEAMPTLGRKFLRAGLGGLNITHSERFDDFCTRYSDKQSVMQTILDAFPPDALRQWVHELGINTFIGTSGRVFPTEMKAAPLLRAWVHRLRNSGVRFHHSHRWLGFDGDSLRIENASGESPNEISIELPSEFPTEFPPEFPKRPNCVILALGGASWPQLGSTGAWLPWLQERGVEMAPLLSANCGFDVEWSAHLREKFSHAPLKSVALSFTDLNGVTESREGEILISDYGVEGSLIYVFSRRLRDYLSVHGQATFNLDILPGKSLERVTADLSRPRGSRSLSRHLQTCLGDNALKRALLYEVLSREQMEDSVTLAKYIKALPITVRSTRPIAEAISTAGGVSFNSVDSNLMLKALPGIFVAGEMLDWEAPTGGYLLTGCFATGRQAALGALGWLRR